MRLKIRQMIMLMTAGFLGLALSSCSKGDSEPEYQKPVEFRGYTARSVTKAGASFVTGAELPKDQPFGVYAYNTGTSETFEPASIATYGKFMTNVPVTYNGNGADVPTNYPYVYRYWPNDEVNNKLAFFAYYPHGTGYGITQTGFADFTFTVQSLPENQVDFMISDVVPGKVYSNTNPTGVVPLSFYHMLTQIRFKGKTDAPSGVTVKIKELKLIGVKGTGVLKPSVTATGSTWPKTSLSGDMTFTITTNGENLTSTAAPIADDNQTLLMIPQELGDNVMLSIKYEIKTTVPNRTITETAEFTLNTAKDTSGEPITEWVRNNQFVYTLNIGLNVIEIKASALDWVDNGEYTISIE